MALAVKGGNVGKTKAPKGRAMLTVSPPDRLLDKINVTTGFSF